MKKSLSLMIILFIVSQLLAQLEPTAGTWKTWVIASGTYEGFVSSLNARYKYYDASSDQYDITSRPVLFFTPFPAILHGIR